MLASLVAVNFARRLFFSVVLCVALRPIGQMVDPALVSSLTHFTSFFRRAIWARHTFVVVFIVRYEIKNMGWQEHLKVVKSLTYVDIRLHPSFLGRIST